MALSVKRQTAHRIWITEINNSNYVKKEGFEANYIELNGKNVSRVNLIVTVVGKFLSEDGNYGAITLDDSTDTIRAKAFGPEVIKLKNIRIGDVITFIGKIKEYNEEKYLAPEVVAVVTDKNWLTLRALELGKAEIKKQVVTEKPTSTIEKPVETNKLTETGTKEEKISTEKISEVKNDDENTSEKILKIIRDLDTGKGAPLAGIIEKSGLGEDSAKEVIVNLLKSGDLFEPTKNMLKVLD